MAKQPNGRFYEYDFENVFIRYLEDAGWTLSAQGLTKL